MSVKFTRITYPSGAYNQIVWGELNDSWNHRFLVRNQFPVSSGCGPFSGSASTLKARQREIMGTENAQSSQRIPFMQYIPYDRFGSSIASGFNDYWYVKQSSLVDGQTVSTHDGSLSTAQNELVAEYESDPYNWATMQIPFKTGMTTSDQLRMALNQTEFEESVPFAIDGELFFRRWFWVGAGYENFVAPVALTDAQSFGYARSGDVIGPWQIEDLQRILSRFKWLVKQTPQTAYLNDYVWSEISFDVPQYAVNAIFYEYRQANRLIDQFQSYTAIEYERVSTTQVNPLGGTINYIPTNPNGAYSTVNVFVVFEMDFPISGMWFDV